MTITDLQSRSLLISPPSTSSEPPCISAYPDRLRLLPGHENASIPALVYLDRFWITPLRRKHSYAARTARATLVGGYPSACLVGRRRNCSIRTRTKTFGTPPVR